MRANGTSRGLLALVDWLALDAMFLLACELFAAWTGFYIEEPFEPRALFICWNAACLLAIGLLPPLATRQRGVRTDQIAGEAFLFSLVLILLFCTCVAVGKFAMPGRRKICTLLLLAPIVVFVTRSVIQWLWGVWRRRMRTGHPILVAGDSPVLHRLTSMLKTEFGDALATHIRSVSVSEAIKEIKLGAYDELYCSLAKETLPLAQELFDYCENNLIRFYGVPEADEYFGRSLRTVELGDVPALTPREEPLRKLSNRILKRTLDIVVSLGFLSTLFVPILLVVAWKIKRESPGPVFFRQRRHGLNGREFLCWKFRSMHVNDRSDTAQTAIDDPRKFPFGDKMRRTNIDELPQFINVLLGDMSLVGPRPHPCKMTDDYSALVNRYRVRLYAKPGVTGWAQINGARGATLNVGDMVKRVRLDIWYLEHWTFWLDIRILFQTFAQTIMGRNKNAF